MTTHSPKNSNTYANIAIVGAGLVGRLLAWRLSHSNPQANIYLFEKDSLTTPRAAANSAAGMISPLSELAISDTEIYRMGVNSLAQWPSWVDELEAQTGERIRYEHEGSLAVAFGQDLSEMKQFHNDLKSKFSDSNGTLEDCEWLDQASIHEIEPQLAEQFEQGLFLKNEAHIDNRQFLEVILKALQYSEVSLIDNAVVSIDKNTVSYTKNHSDHKKQFDLVIDCRGIGSDIKGIRGVRGEVLHVQCDGVQLKRPVRFMHPRYRLYIVPKANNEFVIGATEIESNDTSPISLQSMMELGSALYSLHPGFAEARVIETDVNLRPSLMDNNPKVQFNQGDQTMKINGLYRHGYLLAPEVVKTAENILANKAFDYDWMVEKASDV